MKPGRWIGALTILALVPLLWLVLQGAVRSPEMSDAALLWWRAAALSALVGLAEIYIGSVVVARRHVGLAVAWLALLGFLAVVLVPGVVAELEGRHVWELFETREARTWWGVALILLPSLAVAACLWADVVSGSEGTPDELLLSVTQERNALAKELEALRQGATQALASPLPAPAFPCSECGKPFASPSALAGHRAHCKSSAPDQPLVSPSVWAEAGAPEGVA